MQVKISDVGEVLVRSNVVLDRYWDNPDATAEALASGWFHTGDGGTIDDEGHLTISDRNKDVIITGGENVSSIEVEDCISHLAEVAERLAGFKAPTTVEFRDAIPRTATGKVQKFKLREPYWADHQRGVN